MGPTINLYGAKERQLRTANERARKTGCLDGGELKRGRPHRRLFLWGADQ